MADYNKIGINYNKTRKADLKIFDKIFELLDSPKNKMILDVGAGTGNYANLLADKSNSLMALEPSLEMINQASAHSYVKWINGYVENIDFDNNYFDCTICILSIHHFRDLTKGINEIYRTLKNGGLLLIFTYVPGEQKFFWLQDYFPDLFKFDKEKFPSLDRLNDITSKIGLNLMDVFKHKLYHTSSDNFLAANWRHPEKYLDKEIRNGISTFGLLSESLIASGIEKLQNDLTTGTWNHKYKEILNQDYFDAGYRFIRFKKNKKSLPPTKGYTPCGFQGTMQVWFSLAKLQRVIVSRSRIPARRIPSSVI
jgi:ubiquinone/menaquinone biosynthesis C-methylase UbiE